MGEKRPGFPGHFLDNVGKPLKESVLLRDYSNFNIGGKADYFFEAISITELVKSILLAREHSFPYFIIGGGYNLLFDDDGFRGLIIKNSVIGIKQMGKKAEIEGQTEKELKQILSAAYRDSQKIKGEADKEATDIYAEAYNQDPGFFAFLKSLDAYSESIDEDTFLILTTDSEYFKYIKDSQP